MSARWYTYTAVDAAGDSHTGQVAARGPEEVERQLVGRGLTPITVDLRRSGADYFSGTRVRRRDIADLTRELAALVEAKIPLDRGIQSIAEQETRAGMRAMLGDIASRLASGSTLSAAMEPYHDEFGDAYVETLRAAERTGNIQGVMSHLAGILDQEIEQRQQLTRAMTYPVIVLAVVALAVTVLIVFVIPKFGATFASQGVKMPLATRALVALGNSVTGYWPVYVASLVGAVVGVVLHWRTVGGREFFERMFLRAPILGRVVVATTTARFAGVFGLGLISGLDLIECLRLGARSTGRPRFVSEADRMGERLGRGEGLGSVLEESEYLPNFAKRMLAAGKDSSELSKTSGTVARHYDREASHLMKNMSSMIEPVMTVLLAVIVLTVALSVFLPMWQMVRIKR